MSQQVMSGQPIGYFTACPQGQALVRRFGDRDLAELPSVDRAALVAILGLYLYNTAVHGESSSLGTAAYDSLTIYDDQTTIALREAIDILDGITADEAIAIIQFLVQ